MIRSIARTPGLASTQSRGYAAVAGKAKNVKKKDNFQKTRSLGFKLKKAAPVEKKRISGNAMVKPFPQTVARAANVSDVSELPSLDQEALKSDAPALVAYQGDVAKVCALSSVFGPKRGFELLGERATLLRSESKALFELLDGGKNSKIILTGSEGSGKRELLAHAVAYARVNNWIVLPVPQLLQYINGTSDYAINDDGRVFLLRRNCEFLKKLRNMNGPALKELKLSKKYTFGQTVLEADKSVFDLANLGVSARFFAGEIFDATIAELGLQQTHKVLCAVEEVDILTRPTEYRTPEFRQIYARELQLTHMLRSLPANFVQLMTTTQKNEVAVALGKKPASDFVYETKFDASMVDHVKDAHVLEVGAVSQDESNLLLDYYATRGISLGSKEKLFVTSGGILGELWRGVRSY